jgi:carbon-monoxide dehydrogenase medium subunit
MKPPLFDYHDPATLDEALALLGRYGDEAKILAGGQSLMPLLNFRLVRPRVLIDVNRIPGLDGIRVADGMVRLGALVRQRQIETSAVVRTECPLLHDATAHVGHAAIRTRGTIGGVVAHADPAAEYPAVLAALGGEVVVRSARGERVLGADEFFVTFLTTALAPDEMVTEVRISMMAPGAGRSFVEFSRRHGDFAIVGVAAMLRRDGRGLCAEARIALCGVGGRPHRALGAEAALRGGPLTEAAIRAAAETVAAEITPEGDLHGDPAYRRHLATVLTRRALSAAVPQT